MKITASNCQEKRRSKAIPTFLKKTYVLLNDEENADSIKWAPSGIGFIIVNEQMFSKYVLPKYFKHSNYSSFVRQLNMYNFHKIRQNGSECCFHHQCFDRRDQSSLADIRRKPEKKKRKTHQSHQGIPLSESELSKIQKPNHRTFSQISVRVLKEVNSDVKVGEEKITQNIFEQQGTFHAKKNGLSESSDNLSVEVEEERIQRRLPLVATKELINASKDNICPVSIENVQNSMLSIFY